LYILYKSNDLSNGLSAYILIYGMDGNLQLAYNYENGQQVPFPEANNGNTLNKSSSGCDGNISTMTDAEFENWWANCDSGFYATVVYSSLSNPTGSTAGSTSAFNDWNTSPWQSIDPATIIPIGSNGNNSSWHTPNVTVANEVSISALLGFSYNSLQANWLREQENTNQQILNQIAAYLNANREQNPFGDFTFGDIAPEQFPVNAAAIQYILDLINFSDNTNSTYNFDSGIAKATSFVGTEIECIHNKLMEDTENNFYKQMINTFTTNDFEVLRFEIDNTLNDKWAFTSGHEANNSPWGGFDMYNITLSGNIANSSNLFQMLVLSHEVIHAHMLNSLDNWGYINYDENGDPTPIVFCADGDDYEGVNLNTLSIQERFVAYICAFEVANQYVPDQWLHDLFDIWTFDVDVYRDKLYELLLNEHDWDSESDFLKLTLQAQFGQEQWIEKAAEYMSWKGLEATDAFIVWAQQNNIDPTLDSNGDVIDNAYKFVIDRLKNEGKKDCLQN
jgi:hypothetical protein